MTASAEPIARLFADAAPEARAAVERAVAFARERVPDAPVLAGLEAAAVLAELKLDPQALAAAVLRPLTDGAGLDAQSISEGLGGDVARLVEGVARLEQIRWNQLEREATENLRKMFLAIASDIRVVLIALAERVVVMRAVDVQPDDERRGLAKETMEVYAPLANRLGIWQMKWELEDLAFRVLEPETYRDIKQLLAEKRTSRQAAIDAVIGLLHARLSEVGIAAKVTGRPKHIYSIWKKMRRKKVGYDQIYDVAAVRVIVDRVEECYAALGIAHGNWTPIDGEFDDYIARPKGNDYRSLHTAVIGPDGKPLEIQIRTQEMHEYNEYGVAAHWRYKEGKKSDRRFDEKINWMRQLMEWQREVTDPRDLAESLKTDVFQDQVYVFTPTGEVIDLPQGATPVDFAYRIHTEVGHRCRGAKVNGQIVPLDHALQTGDRVEIITAKGGKPSRDWLSSHTGYVRTASARQKIRQYFRAQERDSAIAQGREVVERELERLGLEQRGVEAALALYPKFDEMDDFLAAVGYGDIVGQSIAGKLLELERREAPPEPLPEAAPAPPPGKVGAKVSIAGVDDVMSQPARCCNPVPGDAVVGFITRGRGLVIHRLDCPNVRNHPEPDRLIALDWGVKPGQTYPVAVRVIASDRPGLLRDIADLVAEEGVNIRATTATKDDRAQTSTVTLTLEIRSSDQVVRLLGKLERLPGTIAAQRIGG